MFWTELMAASYWSAAQLAKHRSLEKGKRGTPLSLPHFLPVQSAQNSNWIINASQHLQHLLSLKKLEHSLMAIFMEIFIEEYENHS